MKYFNRFIITLLLFTSLFLTNSLTAKKRNTTTPITTTTTAPDLPQRKEGYQKAAAKLPTKTYKQLLDDIRIMTHKDVINEDGILTDSFITYITDDAKKANLSPMLTKSLLQAGMNLHGQLSDDNKIALQALSNNKKQIENILTNLTTPLPQPKPVEQKPEKQPTVPQPTSSIAPIAPKSPQSQPKTIEQNRPQQPITTKPSIPAEEILQSSPQQKLAGQQTKPVEPPQLKGIAALNNLRQQSATSPMDNFYANARVNTQWLEKALALVLDGTPLTTKNKAQMQGELVGTATELMREFLHKNKTDTTQRNKIVDDVKNQVINFMNAQKLQDQSPIQKPSITQKNPHSQPTLPQPKKPQSEPVRSGSKQIVADQDIAPSKPIWLSDNNTLITKTLEIEILNYIFKNQDATQKDTLNYFSNQLPKNLKNKDDMVSSMKTTIKKIFPEPEEPVMSTIQPEKKEIIPEIEVPTEEKIAPKELPAWINKDNLLINVTPLKSEILSYFAKHTNADNEEIINYFIGQVPDTYPNMEKVKRQVGIVVTKIFEG